ncbi:MULTISPECIES: hypothetical protein [unclassified Rhizobium]|uniref:hypothetical protein n=1 Tax=unclassified Rhizobium TaxID=2613769 RepID=UPI0007EBC55A|nr:MULTISPECIES: hypothetical protein [unclassified Rhizobium]ANL12057.1 hypothetical protein AMJ98_PA00111 [Rhizobium sp. N1341]ANM42902.1 hypothetical protein AMK03_PA00111 [Rhizobium sp. N741]
MRWQLRSLSIFFASFVLAAAFAAANAQDAKADGILEQIRDTVTRIEAQLKTGDDKHKELLEALANIPPPLKEINQNMVATRDIVARIEALVKTEDDKHKELLLSLAQISTLMRQINESIVANKPASKRAALFVAFDCNEGPPQCNVKAAAMCSVWSYPKGEAIDPRPGTNFPRGIVCYD